jgi:DNA-binding response OmpR family regulator
MKEEKQNLVIFEEDELLISVWRDYFSESHDLNFLDFNSKVENIKKYINKKTIFICNNAVKDDVFHKLKENKTLYLIDTDQNLKNKKLLTDQINYFEKPIYLSALKTEILNISSPQYFKRNEQIGIKNHVLYPFKKKLSYSHDKEYVSLTDKEVSILIKLNESNTIGKNELLIDVWGYNSGIKTSTVETHIHRLRKKLRKFSNSKLEILTNKNGYSIK